MNLSAHRRTWEEASSPAAVRLAQQYEEAWRDRFARSAQKADIAQFLRDGGSDSDSAGERLALLRTDMGLRWEVEDKIRAETYFERYPDLDADTRVALIYEEFCLREEEHGRPDRTEYLARFPRDAEALARVLEIHELVGSATTTLSISAGPAAFAAQGAFPAAGETIGGFLLVEELGRGSFARVFLAHERALADRPVALKVTRRGSREPQTLARLQHTHIVPVHSHQIDEATGLHLLCMPYFGRITLARVLADPQVQAAYSGAALVQALDRLDPADRPAAARPAGRAMLAARPYTRAIAWWGARLAEALEHAHDREVLHRDIKPSNVLITSDGMPMLLDFNLAREPLLGKDATASATLGGTIDYMAPEHLQALAEGSAEDVLDGRADVYGLGVVLYEAVMGTRPFPTPRKAGSVMEVLHRAAALRQRPLPRLRQTHPDVPPALEAVIRRCLEPVPELRYKSAGQLAADLQAVADDQPLLAVREPIASRVAGSLRRSRRQIAVAAVVLFAASLMLLAGLGYLLERSRDYHLVQDEITRGGDAMNNFDYPAAKNHFRSAVDLATRFELRPPDHLTKLKNFGGLGKQITDKIDDIRAGLDFEDLRVKAAEKLNFAERNDQMRADADRLFDAAHDLRFRLLWNEGGELPQITLDLQDVLEPFFVFKRADWITLVFTKNLLEEKRRERLKHDVNELLFLWITAIDESLDSGRGAGETSSSADAKEVEDRARSICDLVLAWVEPKGPWIALRDRLRRHGGGSTGAVQSGRLAEEPVRVAVEQSALAAFQWGLLNLRSRRLPRAIDWLRRAVRIEDGNYWYQYLVAYLEDLSGDVDRALSNYSVAVALQPESPWVRFSRARLYRSKGELDYALEDITSALERLKDRPEACKVKLELGYLYQELGDFKNARLAYDQVIRTDKTGAYAPAARLNRANIDAESGAFERARLEYDALLERDFHDTSGATAALSWSCAWDRRSEPGSTPRHSWICSPTSRTATKCWLHAPWRLCCWASPWRPVRMPPGRSVCCLPPPTTGFISEPFLPPAGPTTSSSIVPKMSRFCPSPDAASSATFARCSRSSIAPRQRTPMSGFARLEPGGHPRRLERTEGRSEGRYQGPRALPLRRALLSDTVARASLRSRSPGRSTTTFERGLAIQANEPGLLEMRGILRAADGDTREALEDFDQAIHRGALDRAYLHKASALMARGQIDDAVTEWSRAAAPRP